MDILYSKGTLRSTAVSFFIKMYRFFAYRRLEELLYTKIYYSIHNLHVSIDVLHKSLQR